MPDRRGLGTKIVVLLDGRYVVERELASQCIVVADRAQTHQHQSVMGPEHVSRHGDHRTGSITPSDTIDPCTSAKENGTLFINLFA